jgi:hypothetical protein
LQTHLRCQIMACVVIPLKRKSRLS